MTSLRAFEAVLRHGTLSGAARELCVTPAAISHRLRDLNNIGSQPLVARHNGRFIATSFGREVADMLGDAFNRIRLADELLSRPNSTIVRVTVPYSFATLWLAGQLPHFEDQYSEADLRILPSHDPLNEAPADVVVVHSDRNPGKGWELLFHDVCAVMGRFDHPFVVSPPADLNDIVSSPLIHVGVQHGSARGAFTWARWCEIMGLRAEIPTTGAHVTAEHLAVDLLQRKEALGLISVINASDLLRRGTLAVVPGSELQSGCSYWIQKTTSPNAKTSYPNLFADWLHTCFETHKLSPPKFATQEMRSRGKADPDG